MPNFNFNHSRELIKTNNFVYRSVQWLWRKIQDKKAIVGYIKLKCNNSNADNNAVNLNAVILNAIIPMKSAAFISRATREEYSLVH